MTALLPKVAALIHSSFDTYVTMLFQCQTSLKISVEPDQLASVRIYTVCHSDCKYMLINGVMRVLQKKMSRRV